MALRRAKRSVAPRAANPASNPASKAVLKAALKAARKPTGMLLPLGLGLSLVWACASTWIALSDHREVRRLAEEAEIQRAAHEDKVRALTRRLVGVASHQMLEQDGLAGRLADIITRQVDLETRQALLAAMAERAASGSPAATSPPASLPARPEPADRPARAGDGGEAGGREGEGAMGERQRVPGRRTSRDAEPALAQRLASMAALSPREQFDRIEASLATVEDGQHRTVTALVAAARAGIAQVRAVLAELRLAIAPAAPAPPSRQGPAGGFFAELALAETALAEGERWQRIADGVPLRAPIDGGGGLSSNFGLRKDPFTGAARMHAGMDFRGSVGLAVHAPAHGRVVVAGPSGAYGNLVEIDHGHDLVTRYGHLAAIAVSVDQAVATGTVLGIVGSTGRSTGPHLHYETRLSGNAVDPARFLAAGQALFGRPAPAAAGGAEPEPIAEAAD